MEDVDPKAWATKRRGRRFGTQRWRRKAQANGQTQRKVVCGPFQGDGWRGKVVGTFDKMVRTPEKTTPTYRQRKPKMTGATPFEADLGFTMASDMTYALSRHRQWEVVDALIADAAMDTPAGGDEEEAGGEEEKKSSHLAQARANTEVWRVPIGKTNQGLGTQGMTGKRSISCAVPRTFIAYYDLDDLERKLEAMQRVTKRANTSAGLEHLNSVSAFTNDSNPYVQDAFFRSMVSKSSAFRQQQAALALMFYTPPVVQQRKLKEVRVKGLKGRTTLRGCRTKRARLGCYGLASYWSPAHYDDTRDYLELDLGEDMRVQAIGTRGRPLKRKIHDLAESERPSGLPPGADAAAHSSKPSRPRTRPGNRRRGRKSNKRRPATYDDFTVMQENPQEYVTRYRVWIKRDDRKQKAAPSRRRRRRQAAARESSPSDASSSSSSPSPATPSSSLAGWTSLGTFAGNEHPEKTVVNLMRAPAGAAAVEAAESARLSRADKDDVIGVIARYIRIQPLSAAQRGFVGRKCLRVGVYGKHVPAKAKGKKAAKKRAAGSADEEVKEADEDESLLLAALGKAKDKNKDKRKGDGSRSREVLMTNKSVPAAIVCVRHGGVANCTWGSAFHDGIVSCPCGNCRHSKYEKQERHRRHRLRRKRQVVRLHREALEDGASEE